MYHTHKLEALGLSPAEAGVYLALIEAETRLSAQAIADSTGTARSSVYQVVRSLADKGLVEGGAGYGGRYSAVSPEEGLPNLIEREREMLVEKEGLAKELAKLLASSFGDGPIEKDVVEILRNPRVIADRFDRLQLEAQDEINGLVKAPLLSPRHSNPIEDKVLRRGVRVRALYESAVLDNKEIAPYIGRWVEAGEEARIYEGILPMKLQLFDARTALLPLEVTAAAPPQTEAIEELLDNRRERHQITAIIIRHPSLGAGLKVLFDTLWERGRPLAGPSHSE